MNTTTLAVLAVMMCMGVTMAAYGSGYTYMPVSGGYSGYGSAGLDNSFLYIIGFLFLILILFQGNLFNTTSSSTTPIAIIQG